MAVNDERKELGELKHPVGLTFRTISTNVLRIRNCIDSPASLLALDRRTYAAASATSARRSMPQ